VKILKLYTGVLTAIVIVFIVFCVYRQDSSDHYKELTAERINIVDADGKLQMVISNAARQHPGIIDGKVIAARERPAGIIFFNTDGDECGGLIFDGDKKGAGMVYSVDQYKNDQVLQLQYSQDNTAKPVRSYGLKLWDRSDSFSLGSLLHINDSLQQLHDTAIYNREIKNLQTKGLLGTERLFVGETRDKQVGIFINDKKGIPRIKMYVDENNKPVVEVLDSSGAKAIR
ncbi:MAG: hypothetical protein ACRDE5_12820, partial [Ginsengibacter sp.]